MDFFYWSQMKNLVYDSPVPSVEDITNPIAVAAGSLRDTLKRKEFHTVTLSILHDDFWL